MERASMGYILGLSGGYYHDSSACVIRDGKILGYSEEERWSRRKQNSNSRTCSCSVLSCLDQAGINSADIEHVAISWNPRFPTQTDSIDDDELRKELFAGLDLKPLPRRFSVVEHHRSHAASSFYCSGFDEASVLVVDGSGDGLSTTIWKASQRGGLERVEAYDFRQSLGWFYETATEYIGFPNWSSAGKFMGLASYGNPIYDFNDILTAKYDGYELKYSFSGVEEEFVSLVYYRRLKKNLFEYFERRKIPRALQKNIFSPLSGLWEPHTEFSDIHKDFAASIQMLLQECLASLVRYSLTRLGIKKICLSGGVALNCAANGYLSETFPELEFFICPFANDSGGSIGAAMELSRETSSNFSPVRLEGAGIGPSFSDQFIEQALKQSGLRYSKCESFPQLVAQSISRGKVVGWFQGRAEAGPRALGHRSILADPRSTAIRDRVNNTTKTRELWRPLCPSISSDKISRFSRSDRGDDFMLVAQRATTVAIEQIPGVVHVDGTMRCQQVSHRVNPPYHNLLTQLEQTIGVPVVLNTSFNRRGEPIVNSPLDAVRTFVSTDIDLLSIGNFIVYK